MTPRKIEKAFRIAGIPEMPMVREHILRNVQDAVPTDVLAGMTSKQLAALISAANASYHDGRASKGDVELVDGDTVWIGLSVQELLPIDVLSRITKQETVNYTYHNTNYAPSGDSWYDKNGNQHMHLRELNHDQLAELWRNGDMCLRRPHYETTYSL